MKGTIKVLMFKHAVVRMRRFIHTSVELISPTVFFIILFAFKDHINQPIPQHAMEQSNIYRTDPTPLESVPHNFQMSLIQMFYMPDNNVTRMLMEQVGQKLGLKRLQYFPKRSSDFGYYPINEMSDFSRLEYIKEISERHVVVSFENVSDSFPERLEYAIHIKKDFNMDTYKPMDDDIGPRMGFGLIYEPFMRIQWAIDTSFLLLAKGVDFKQTVSLQEFPYVMPKNINTNIVMVCDALQVLCWMSLLLTFVFLMTRLLEERTTGIEELIKMMGVSTNTLALSHFLNVVPTGLVYSVVDTALLTASPEPLVPGSNPLIIATALALHFVSVVAMAFACSYLIKNTQYAVSLSLFAYIALWVPAQAVGGRAAPWALRPLLALLPHVPLAHFWDELGAREKFGGGVTLASVWSVHTQHTCSVAFCLVAMLVQSCLFFLLAWYLSLVNPGPYGQPLPLGFIFQREYWGQRKVKPDIEVELEEPIAQDPLLFEEAPKNLEAGIRILNVSKVFGKNLVLSNVSLDIYKGEITVLLGHNGAGKTTLMNIITGLTAPTAGAVLVEGQEAAAQRRRLRALLGLCPQHDLFFPDLTVLEHIVFFTMLKGSGEGSGEGSGVGAARAAARALAARLGLAAKGGEGARALSGGMRRRLQLACALAGGARLLVLDEPTSGLDVETRRSLWDLLLSLRGERTVLLTTHFMEEADALGDRVAALHGGRLRCHATPMHLKRALGSGYRVSLTTVGAPREAAISAAVRACVGEAALRGAAPNGLAYALPARSQPLFPALFRALEARRSDLAIDSIGVGLTTLEEVFLKLCSDVDTTFSEDAADTVDGAPAAATHKKVTGPLLYWRQFLVLLKRQGSYMMSKKYSILVLQVILPILSLVAFTRITIDEKPEPHEKSHATLLDLSLYADMPERRVLYWAGGAAGAEGAGGAGALRALGGAGVRFERADDVAAALIQKGSDLTEYNKYLIGFELNETDAKVLYTTRLRHAAPVALNLLANYAAASARAPARAPAPALLVHNEPLGGWAQAGVRQGGFVEPKSTVNCVFWATGTVFVVLATLINLVSLPCVEREGGARQLQALAGCAGATLWAAALAAHAALALLSLVLPALAAPALLDADRTLSHPAFLGAMFVILLLGCLAFLSFMYLVSFYMGERGASSVLVACVVVFGLLTTSLQTATEVFRSGQPRNWTQLAVGACGLLAPPHALVEAAARAALAARLRALCRLNRHRCPAPAPLEPAFDQRACCELNEYPRCYFCIDDYAPGEFMLILFCQFVVYMGLVLLTQEGVFQRLWARLCGRRYAAPRPPPTPPTPPSPTARAEATYVAKAIALPKEQIQEAMLVDNLHKNYVNLFSKSCNAVKGVSFSVKKGECFGLLGVNGAGKSTTFKMITAAECPTRGSLFANGHRLHEERAEYMRSLSYCPQSSGLDGFLSGYDNLALLLTLRGLSSEDVKAEAKSWIEVVGLEAFAGRAVERYSGGMARRLAAGAALSCAAAATLLDEPTAGVDAGARRKVWAALRRALRQRRALVVTSHSMDEMEALCERIAIMSAGRVRALGSAAALRAAHAAGHAVRLKLRPGAPATPTGPTPGPTTADVTDGGKADVLKLKGELQQKFNCQLKDEHKTMLHYHINETMRYSELFSELEALKESNPIVEDYSVTETTLEEVFLSFAQEGEASEEAPITPV